MAQIIEAKAILSAADKTGGIFSRIAAKIRGVNAAAANANRTAAATSRMSVLAQRAAASSAAANAGVYAASARVLGPAAVALGGAKAFKSFADTDLAVTRIGITADATDEQIRTLQASMRDLAFQSGKSFAEVRDGMDSLVAGGMNLPEALPALPAIAKTAQAAGAEIRDMATTTLALNQNLGIATDKMQSAFDILVKGGKAGKFELKDMARFFPSIAPAAVAAGMKGEQGLMRIVAALQTIRAGTGTTEEAAASLQNIFAKMESEKTTGAFKAFGIDLRSEMAKARKEGKDLLSVFIELTERATKGDLSKIPQLFSDMEFARGMRALLSFRKLNADVMEQLRNAAGASELDFQRVMKSPAIAVNQLSESFSRLGTSIGYAIEQAGKLVDEGGTSGILGKVAGYFEKLADDEFNVNERAEKYHRDVLRKTQIDRLDGIIANQEKLLADPKRSAAAADRYRFAFPGAPMPAGLDQQAATRALHEARLKKFELLMERHLDDMPKLPELFAGGELKRMRENLEMRLAAQEEIDRERRRGIARSPSLQGEAGGASMLSGEPGPVTAELTGEADVKGEATVIVKIEAPELIRAYHNAQQAMEVVGKLRTTNNGPGSTGRSSPDAAPSVGFSGVP